MLSLRLYGYSIMCMKPNNSPQGLETLNNFVGGKGTESRLVRLRHTMKCILDVEIAIAGYESSTQVESLVPAFESLNITTILPGLNTSLLSSGALESKFLSFPDPSLLTLVVLATTFHTDNISHVTVSLANPFTATFTITGITSTVTSHNLSLGSINMSTVSNFSAAGKQTTMSPPLNLAMNYDPSTLFTLTRVLAVDAGLDVAPLDGIVALGGYQYVASTDADSGPPSRRANMYTYVNRLLVLLSGHR